MSSIFGPVRGLTAKPLADNIVSLSWLSPMGRKGNRAVAQYEITVNQGAKLNAHPQLPGYPKRVAKSAHAGETLLVSGLEPHVEYVIGVRALAKGIFKLAGPWEFAHVNAPAVVQPIGVRVAAKAESYIGHRYVYGGVSDVIGGWDCSSFASWLLGHDFALKIPSWTGEYTTWADATASGTQHGVTAAVWKSWPGAVDIFRSEARPGDLLCWQTHVGFVSKDGKHMISAYDTADGTILTPIDAGPSGEALQVRRVKRF